MRGNNKVPSDGASPAAPISRRQRQRLATYDEIVAVSRGLLRDGKETSLRAISAEMGMTPQALYRYVASTDELHSLVAKDIFADIVRTMTRATDRYPEDPAAQLAASTTALRGWALTNKPEFKVVFTNPLVTARPRTGAVMDFARTTEPEDGSKLFSDYFAGIFIRLTAQRLITVPPAADLDSSFRQLIEQGTRPAERRIMEALGLEGAGTFWLFKLAWARLYGVLVLEVFGLIEAPLIESRALFDTLMRENFQSLGLVDSWDRLSAVSREVEGVSPPPHSPSPASEATDLA